GNKQNRPKTSLPNKDPRNPEKEKSSEILEAVRAQQNRLKQLEEDIKKQKETEQDLRREPRKRRELEEKLRKIEANLKDRSDRGPTPEGNHDPFTQEIMKEKVPRNFKPPDMDLYDGTTDPSHHLSNFRSRMYLVDASDAIRCKAFPTTLTKSAMKWFDNLPPRSITSFEDLTKKFLTRFSIQKDKAKHAPSLLGIKQGNQETLREYMERFNKACLDIQHLPTEAAIMGLANGLKEGPFSQSLSKRYPTSLYEVQERAEKYINMEETSQLRDSSRKESTYPFRDRDREQKKKEESNSDKPR
ncbi:hypothetical protein S245_024142, partial [Arachis hypogaea]